VEEEKIKITLDIKKFIEFHKGRIELLKKFDDEEIPKKIIYQLSFLGIESLAKVRYHNDNPSSDIRFKSLLSPIIGNEEAERYYKFWRCPLIHQGYITEEWTSLETWDDNDISFIEFPDIGVRSCTEYPSGSIIAIYNRLILVIEDYFNEKNLKYIEL